MQCDALVIEFSRCEDELFLLEKRFVVMILIKRQQSWEISPKKPFNKNY